MESKPTALLPDPVYAFYGFVDLGDLGTPVERCAFVSDALVALVDDGDSQGNDSGGPWFALPTIPTEQGCVIGVHRATISYFDEPNSLRELIGQRPISRFSPFFSLLKI